MTSIKRFHVKLRYRLHAVQFVLLLFGAATSPVASSQIMANHCTCVVQQSYVLGRQGMLTKPTDSAKKVAQRNFSVDLRNGSISQNPIEDLGVGDVRLWSSPSRDAWHAVWIPRANQADIPSSTLQLLRQKPEKPGTLPISFLASTGLRVFTGVCIEAPPAAILSD